MLDNIKNKYIKKAQIPINIIKMPTEIIEYQLIRNELYKK